MKLLNWVTTVTDRIDGRHQMFILLSLINKILTCVYRQGVLWELWFVVDKKLMLDTDDQLQAATVKNSKQHWQGENNTEY